MRDRPAFEAAIRKHRFVARKPVWTIQCLLHDEPVRTSLPYQLCKTSRLSRLAARGPGGQLNLGNEPMQRFRFTKARQAYAHLRLACLGQAPLRTRLSSQLSRRPGASMTPRARWPCSSARRDRLDDRDMSWSTYWTCWNTAVIGAPYKSQRATHSNLASCAPTPRLDRSVCAEKSVQV